MLCVMLCPKMYGVGSYVVSLWFLQCNARPYVCGLHSTTIHMWALVSIVTLQISDVSGLSHLSHLRVLNLAGNEITVVSGLFELTSLTELNLRRNRVRQVVSACMCVCRGGRWEGMGVESSCGSSEDSCEYTIYM